MNQYSAHNKRASMSLEDVMVTLSRKSVEQPDQSISRHPETPEKQPPASSPTQPEPNAIPGETSSPKPTDIRGKHGTTARVLSKAFLLHKQAANRSMKALFKMYDNDPAKVMEGLLDTLVEGKYAQPTGPVETSSAPNNSATCIKSPEHVDVLVFGLLPRLPPSLQLKLLDTLTAMISSRLWNAAACTRVGLLSHLVGFLVDEASGVGLMSNNTDSDHRVLLWERIMRLIQLLGSHKLQSNDLLALFDLFWVTSIKDRREEYSGCSLTLRALAAMARAKNGPRAFFQMQSEDHSRMRLSKIANLPSGGYTFSAWIRLERFETSGSKAPSLFSLSALSPDEEAEMAVTASNLRRSSSASTGSWSAGTDAGYGAQSPSRGRRSVSSSEKHGVECLFQARQLVLRSYQRKGKVSMSVLPMKLVKSDWVWVSVVHTKKALWRSDVAWYVNGDLVTTGKLPYPEASLMRPLKVTLGGYGGQLGHVCMFNQPLADHQVRSLWEVLCSPFATVLSPPLCPVSPRPFLTAQMVNKNLMFALDARYTRSRTVDGYRTTTVAFNCGQADIYATLEGVAAVVTSQVKDSFTSLGGASALLPLLVAAQQAPADVLPQQLEAPRIGPLAHAQVVALMASVIRFSPANLWLLMRGQGLRLLGLILRNAEHAFLTAKLWDAVKQIASAVRSYDDASISKELYRRLILDMRIWGRASVSVQEAVLADLKERVVESSDYMFKVMRSCKASETLLDSLALIYWVGSPLEHSLAWRPKFTEEETIGLRYKVVAVVAELELRRPLEDIFESLQLVSRYLVDSEPDQHLVQFAWLLRQLICSRKHAEQLCLHHEDIDTARWWHVCCRELEDLRLAVVRLVRAYYHVVSEHIPGFQVYDMVHGHASMLLECLRPYPLGAKIYKELRGLMLAEPIEGQTAEPSPDLPVRRQSIIFVILELLVSAPYIIQLMVIRDVMITFTTPTAAAKDSRELLRQVPGWHRWLLKLVAMQEVNLNNQRKAKASATSSSAATEEAKPERVSALCKMLKNKHLPLEARIKAAHDLGVLKAAQGARAMLSLMRESVLRSRLRDEFVVAISLNFPGYHDELVQEMALELLCKLQNDWRSVEDAQVCLEIFGEKWGFRAGGQVGGPTLGRILHRILLKAKVRLLEGSILKRGTPLWENVVFMCHLCSDVVLLRVGASTASSSLRLRQSLRDILLDVWELLLPQLAGVGDAGIGTMTKSGAVCAFPSCDQRTQIGSPYCVAHGASIGRNGNNRRVRVAEDEAARALHPGGCVWRMLQLQLQLLDDSVETGLLYQTNINRSRRRPDTAQWRRRRAAAETQLARLSIRTCEQVRRLHGWMGRAGMLQNAQAEDRQSADKSDGAGQKAAAHPEGHYRHTRMEMALLIYSITQCFKLLGRVCTLGWKKAQKQMRPLLRLLVMETGPHLSSRAQNRRVVSTLRQAAHVGTSPEHWELWLEDPQCTFKSATDRIDGINNVYWTSLAQHLERRQNFLKEAMDVADKEAKNARVLMVTGCEKRLYDSYKAERQRILDTQRTKKLDFLEGWRRLRRLMRTFALTPGPWTMVLGSDDESRDLASPGGEGSMVARRHQQQMYWKLCSAQNCVGMRMIMRYNWRATNHADARILTDASKYGTKAVEAAMHQFEKVRPKNSDSAADASTEATEAEAEVADPATERDTVNEQDLKMQEWDNSAAGAVRYATEAELIMPMCVVLGTLELSDTHVSFFGERFGGPGTGVGKTTKEVAWVPDEERSQCKRCGSNFSSLLFTSGKHHCRSCGEVFCASCSEHRKPLPHLGFYEPVRVCTDCFETSTKTDAIADPDATATAGANPEPIKLSKLKRRRWPLHEIRSVYRRRYLLRPTALEMFLPTGASVFVNFFGKDENLTVLKKLLALAPPSSPLLAESSLAGLTPRQLIRKTSYTRRWQQREISNFEYLMFLNRAAGRTYNNLTQYYIFPWVLTDYESAEIDLSDDRVFRDLSKPVGALNPDRLKKLRERMALFDDPEIPKFLYGSHYSTLGAVLFYLIRMEPFASHALTLQSGKFDHAERLFHSVAETWQNCLTNPSDLKELTPEWFYNAEFLRNSNSLPLGERQNGVVVGDVVLPPWARGSPERFVQIQRQALESEYVSMHLHLWIDLIFGFKQRGDEAVKADNVFYYLTYEDAADTSNISDPLQRQSIESQISNFGQTPSQLFTSPHVQRSARNAPCRPASDQAPVSLQVITSRKDTATAVAAEEALAEAASSTPSLRASSPKPEAAPAGKAPEKGGMVAALLPVPGRSSVYVIGDESFAVVSIGSSGPKISMRCRAAEGLEGCGSRLGTQTAAVAGGGSALLLGCHWSGEAIVISLADLSRRLHYIAPLEAGRITSVAASCDGTRMVLGDSNGRVAVWAAKKRSGDFKKLAPLLQVLPQTATAESALASDSAYRNVERPEAVIWGHTSAVVAVCVNEDLDIIVSGSAKNMCLIHALSSAQFIRSLDLEKPEVVVAGASAADSLNSSAGAKEDTASCRVNLLALANDGTIVAFSISEVSGAGMLQVLNLNNRCLASRPIPRTDTLLSVSMSPNARYLLTSSASRIQVLRTHSLESTMVVECAPSATILCSTLWCPSSVKEAEKKHAWALAGLSDGKVVGYPLDLDASA